MFDGGSGHIRLFTCRSLQKLVNMHGFSIIKSFGTHELSMPVGTLKSFDMLLSRKVSIASNMGLGCKKIDT